MDFDVIILGAGPAGSTCAIALQKSGLKVALIDKETFPRDKICGDAVSSVTKRVLRQIHPDLEKKLEAFPPKQIISEATLHSPKFQSLTITFSKTGHCIKRVEFDNWLFELAKQNRDVTVFENQKVTDVVTNAEFAAVTLHNGTILKAKVVVGCDGAQGIAAKKLIDFKVNRNHYSGAVRQYYKNVEGLTGTALEVYFLKGYLPGYFWIFPLPNQEANVGFGMLSQTIAEQKIDLKQSLHQIINEIPEVAARFKNAVPLETVKGFGLPLGSKKYPISGNRFMLCGDAASLIDPFSGEGIETAMESGKFAAEQIIQSHLKNDFSAQTLIAYNQRVYAKMWPNFKNHYLLQRLLGKKLWLINGLIAFGNIPWINKKIPKLFY